jgi:hypothetical protein
LRRTAPPPTSRCHPQALTHLGSPEVRWSLNRRYGLSPPHRPPGRRWGGLPLFQGFGERGPGVFRPSLLPRLERRAAPYVVIAAGVSDELDGEDEVLLAHPSVKKCHVSRWSSITPITRPATAGLGEISRSPTSASVDQSIRLRSSGTHTTDGLAPAKSTSAHLRTQSPRQYLSRFGSRADSTPPMPQRRRLGAG